MNDLNYGMGQEDIINEHDLTDDLAASNFIENFIHTYGGNHLNFNNCTLQEAVHISFFELVEQRKILLLYLHNDVDEFSKMFCKNLIEGKIRNVIEENYFLLAWDLSCDAHRDVLVSSVVTYLDPAIETFIKKKTASAFFIVPVEQTLTILAVSYGKSVTEEELHLTLENCLLLFKDIWKNALELDSIKESNSTDNDFNSTRFQQLMFDQLGDRDYDCIENSEHDCLKAKIGFATYGPPISESGYTKDQNKHIEKAYEKIKKCSDAISKWKGQIIISFIYNCTEPLPEEKIKRSKKYADYNPDTDILPLPIYVLRKCEGSENPCRIFIDYDLRVYSSWSEYITNNKLHKCQMVLPKDGRYSGDIQGNVLLERHLSPSCGIGPSILKGTDVASTIAGVASGGIFIAAMIPAIAVAPIALTAAAITGVGVGFYSLVRSSASLVDRIKHKQTVSFSNSEARGAYINIVAGSLGFFGAGTNILVSHLAARGVNIGQGARATINMVNLANIGASGVGIANSGYDVFEQYLDNRSPSVLTILQLGSSILFFGNAVYNYQSATTTIENCQSKSLQDYHDSLRSNRHRKTFNKLVKETIRQNGDASVGRAEVIASLRKIPNKDEVFAILTRNNKLLNEKGVKYAVQDGSITFNGVAVDIINFGRLSPNGNAQLLINLPETPPTQQQIESVSITMKTIFNVENLETIVMFKESLVINGFTFSNLVASLIGRFSQSIQEKIICMLSTFLEELVKENIDIPTIFNENTLNSDKLLVLLKIIFAFLKIKANDYDEREHQSPVTIQKTIEYFEMAVMYYFNGGNLTEMFLNELLTYFRECTVNGIYNYLHQFEREQERILNHDKKIKCGVCNGYYYSK